MGGVDSGVVEHGDRVVGHLGERVGPVGLVAATGAPIVEGEGAERPGEPEPLQVPEMLVGAEALDEQRRRRTRAGR